MSHEFLANAAQAKLDMIANYACETGESPLWHPKERRLYWSDIPAGRLFRYTPSTGAHEQAGRWLHHTGERGTASVHGSRHDRFLARRGGD